MSHSLDFAFHCEESLWSQNVKQSVSVLDYAYSVTMNPDPNEVSSRGERKVQLKHLLPRPARNYLLYSSVNNAEATSR